MDLNIKTKFNRGEIAKIIGSKTSFAIACIRIEVREAPLISYEGLVLGPFGEATRSGVMEEVLLEKIEKKEGEN